MSERIAAYLTFLANERGLSGNTVAAYRNDLAQLDDYLSSNALASGESIPWGMVEREHLGGFFLHLRGRGYAPATLARKVAAMKTFFHYLRQRGEIAADPTDGIGAPEVKKSVPQAIAAGEVATLLAFTAHRDTPDGVRDQAMLRLLYSTGMRVGELTSLNVSDVNLPAATVRVIGRGGRERTLVLDSGTLPLLRAYLSRARPYLVRHYRDEQALVLNHRGQRLTRQGFWLVMKTLVRDSGLAEGITPHTLRHSFAAHQIREGLALEQLRLLLGHASISTTQMYSDSSRHLAKPAANVPPPRRNTSRRALVAS